MTAVMKFKGKAGIMKINRYKFTLRSPAHPYETYAHIPLSEAERAGTVVKEQPVHYTARRLRPKNDFIFRRLFGEQQSKASLLALLNAILRLEGKQKLTDITIMDNTALTKEMIKDKTGRLDVLAKTQDESLINIEMQLGNERNMDKRTLFYSGKLLLQSIKSGQKYQNLKRTITINLLDFTYLPTKTFHSTFHLYEDQEKHVMLTDALEIHFIEFPKFKKAAKDITKPLHRWLMFLDESTTNKQLKELMAMDQAIKQTEERLAWLSSDDETRLLYEYRENSRIERNSIFHSGKEEGQKQGLMQAAKNMKAKGLDLKMISEVTGLTEAEIKKL